MRFRTRLVVAATAAVAIAVLAACAAAFVTSRNAVVSSIDDSLSSSAAQALNSAIIDSGDVLGNILQVVAADGTVVVPGQPVQLPVDQAVMAVASGQRSTYYTNATVHGVAVRELVTPLPVGTFVRGSGGGGVLTETAAMQIAYPLTGVNQQLRRLGFELLLVAIAGVVLAVLLGWMVGRTALVPLDDLTRSVEDVATTIDVSRRLDVGEDDELGRLRRAFNSLLAALERSQGAQRRLVLDAAHELRTPITSLRTNLEVVRRLDELPESDREVLVADVLTQLQELTSLVGDLAELARGDQAEHPPTLLRLDQLVGDASSVAVTHGRARGIDVHAVTEPTWVKARRDRVNRAVGNLLDNALKWSPDGSTVEITCARGEVVVQDHGPGISPEDLPHIFDRFYRSADARGLPGSGLGLAIVAQVAESEGGSVTVDSQPGRGARFTLRLPTVPLPPDGADLDGDGDVGAP